MPSGHLPFALLNRTGNPLLKALLRSPLHALAGSGSIGLISVTGRRSRREFTIPVFYSRQGNTVKIGVGFPERKAWWRNLRGEGAAVRMRIGGEERTGHAIARGDARSGVTVEVDLRPAYS